jgi:hypothetical protein
MIKQVARQDVISDLRCPSKMNVEYAKGFFHTAVSDGVKDAASSTAETAWCQMFLLAIRQSCYA